ncbi:ABC transporter [Hydrogenophaga crassostreae]|uniref:ABC transporter n=1 Tax=Hydrogenophaga crassostreae TaxID=1763535 RepID=A0A167H4G6_9BURK|nr:ATP-binding cassette domain-containing protein [Hydrogenophaga crassostreae]AOW15478.1 ABC transporter [Hydrogenophaga crassostreae]OAD40263.1 ABC transporter [Hydrogenophaga crassostreae]
MIETQGLVCAFADGTALRFADVALPQGGTLLLRGPSGSGKSTWLALAGGLRAPSQGAMVVAGQAPSELKPAARDAWRAGSVGFLPQRLHLSEALSVQDNLMLVFFAAGRPANAPAVHQALSALGVAGLARRKPARLSGGELQRVALARALLLRPRVILADEPTASLDDTACDGVLALLQNQAREGRTSLVIATHDARVAQALPDAQVLSLDKDTR